MTMDPTAMSAEMKKRIADANAGRPVAPTKVPEKTLRPPKSK